MSNRSDQWRSGFTAQWAFTDRFCVVTNQDGPVDGSVVEPAQRGASKPPFDEFNLATHVGDDLAAVQDNREQSLAAIGGASAGTHVIGAAHSANVAIIDEPGDGAAAWEVTEGVDSLVTTVPDLALLGLGADCAVITFADLEAGVVAVAHSGWQGLVKGIIPATIDTMCGLGASPETIHATVGPSICGQCYEVDAERAAEVESVVPEAVFESQGRYGIDIALGAATQLGSLGVVATTSGVCTFESERHFSYRRSGVSDRRDGVTGRQGAAIVLRAGEAQ